MIVGGVIAGALVMLILWRGLTRAKLPPAERGRRIAEESGCFGCHGPGGTQGVSNPGRADKTVPSFTGDLMMYASSEDDIRAWIRDGVTPTRATSATWQAEKAKGALKMPAFKNKLSDKEIDDLVAYIKAINGWETPQDSLASAGLTRAGELGCFGCHGVGGRLARPNPRSFKGYIASWMTDDFADLVQNRKEFDEWVSDGISGRFARGRLASFFEGRSLIKMPPYKDHLKPGDLDGLWAYVQWLRAEKK
jgi:mono/diheme cytochrome c family protein